MFLVATYTDGQPTESAAWFCKWLEEAANDFRFGKSFLKGLRYAVFGLGNSVYVDHYNTVSVIAEVTLCSVFCGSAGEGESRSPCLAAHELYFQAWPLLSTLPALFNSGCI